ncbi:MAG TPA: ROK family protein [Usitatibacter sp.]|nr:ROK family protein [Usitatibacter sp.]
MSNPRKILVVDVGGTHVKCAVTGDDSPREFKSGPKMTPKRMTRQLLALTSDWRFDAVSIGYPGVVLHGKIVREPFNLGRGWVGFDFRAALKRPVRIANDAVMQALGCYDGGKMLFLGLGTGLGSALIMDGIAAPMELGHLHCGPSRTYEDLLGERGRKRVGDRRWRKRVDDVVQSLSRALLPDYIVLGGGNARRLKRLPPNVRRGDNSYAFPGGVRLWDDKPVRGNR